MEGEFSGTGRGLANTKHSRISAHNELTGNQILCSRGFYHRGTSDALGRRSPIQRMAHIVRLISMNGE
jgi:hypothetical protein